MPPELGPLLNVGSVGLVLAWFMFKAEPRLEQIEEAIDRNTRGQMLFLLAMDHAPPQVKASAQAMLEELTDAEKTRIKRR